MIHLMLQLQDSKAQKPLESLWAAARWKYLSKNCRQHSMVRESWTVGSGGVILRSEFWNNAVQTSSMILVDESRHKILLGR